MKGTRIISMVIGLTVVATSVGCGWLSRPPTQREETAAVGGVAGGLGGAIIGSFAGSAVTGGLFGLPLGAVAGYYVGDQMASRNRSAQDRLEERDAEIDRLRRENERLRREEDRPARPQESSQRQPQGTAPEQASSEQARQENQYTTSSQQATTGSEQAMITRQQLRQLQRRLNDMGYNAGQVDGIWGPRTQAAVRNFQQSKGLRATGRLNEQTMDALGDFHAKESKQTRADSSRRSAAQPDKEAPATTQDK